MAEVTILGAGIFGLSIAWRCTQAGARVRVIDPAGVGAGASGGVLGALAPHVPENWNTKKAFQLESLLAAEKFWADVDAAGGGSSGYGRTGRLQPLADDAAVALAEKRTQTARDLWQGRAIWQVTDTPKDSAWAPPSPSGLWVHDTLSARIHPRNACLSLAAALIAKGAEITTDGPQTGAVIHATGTAGLAELNLATGLPIGTGIKGQAAVLDAGQPPDRPQIFAEALHVIPHQNGSVAIGSTTERDFTDPTATDDQLDALITKARALVPALADAPVVQRWAGLRPRAKTRAPLLGHYPNRRRHFVANGGFKIGIGMAPKIADCMAALVLEGRHDMPPEFDIANLLNA